MLRSKSIPVALIALVALSGCSGDPSQLPDPVEISGTVTTADGKPVKDVQLVLRPKGSGHTAGCALGSDGQFKVSAIPGEFMFFFQPMEDAKADKGKVKAGFAAVPKAYQDVNVEHTVSLSSGGSNKIQLK
jgi:hypothetical protein